MPATTVTTDTGLMLSNTMPVPFEDARALLEQARTAAAVLPGLFTLTADSVPDTADTVAHYLTLTSVLHRSVGTFQVWEAGAARFELVALADDGQRDLGAFPTLATAFAAIRAEVSRDCAETRAVVEAIGEALRH